MALYADHLIIIEDDSILFKCYGAFGRDRRVAFSEIDRVEIVKPNLWTGKWRHHGSGDFKTWFPADYDRHRRDRIFVAHLPGRWWRVGFTAVDSDAVLSILRDKGLVAP